MPFLETDTPEPGTWKVQSCSSAPSWVRTWRPTWEPLPLWKASRWTRSLWPVDETTSRTLDATSTDNRPPGRCDWRCAGGERCDGIALPASAAPDPTLVATRARAAATVTVTTTTGRGRRGTTAGRPTIATTWALCTRRATGQRHPSQPRAPRTSLRGRIASTVVVPILRTMTISAGECLICDKHAAADPGLEIHRDELVYVGHLPAISPAYLGHLFAEPLEHRQGLADLTGSQAAALGRAMRQAAAVLVAAGHDHVYSFVYGDRVPHLHVHLVGRRPGAPAEFRGVRVDEWPDAPRGDAAAVAAYVATLRALWGDHE